MRSKFNKFIIFAVLILNLFLPAEVFAMTTNATWDQEHFWFRDDDGSETTATGYDTGNLGVDANIDAGNTFSVGQAFRLRMALLKNNAGDASLTTTPRLEFKAGGTAGSCTTDTWTVVPVEASCGGTAICQASSGNFTDGTATTRQVDTTHTRVGGDMIETAGSANAVTFGTGSNTEHAEWEWMLDTNNAAASTVYTFRLTSAGTPYTNYSVCPTLETDAPNITVSGTVLSSAGGTETVCDANGGTNELSMRVGSTTYNASCTDSTGAFSFSVPPPSAGTGMVIWINDLGTDGATVVRYDGSGNSTNNILYESTVSVTSDDTNPVDITDMDTFDSAGDLDIPYSATAATSLTVTSGFNLRVNLKSGVANGSTVFDPGGTVTLSSPGGGSLHIDDNAAADLDTATNSINGDILVDGGATLRINAATNVNGGDITTSGTSATVTTTAGTPTVTMSGTGSIGGGTTPTLTFYTLSTTGTGTTTISNALTFNNSISVGAGTTLTIGASLNGGGSLTTASTAIVNYSGTPTVTLSGAGILGGGSGSITLYSLVANGSGNNTNMNSTIVVDNTLTIGSNHTFAMSGNSITVGSSSVTNSGGITISGIISQTSSGTTTIRSSSSGSATIGGTGCTSTNCTFGNLIFGPTVASAPTFTLGSAGGQVINIAGAMTIGNGTPVTVNAETNDPILDVNGNFVFAECSSCATTFSASSTASFTVGGSWTNSSDGVFTPNSGTVTMDATSGGPSIMSVGDPFNNLSIDNGGTAITWTLDDALDVNGNLLIDTSNTLDSSTDNFNVNVAGNWTNNGTYTAGTNVTTLDGAGGTTQIIIGGIDASSLTITASATRTIQVGQVQSILISNNLILSGASCSAMLIFRSSNLGTEFFIDNADVTPTVAYTDFQDTNVGASIPFSSGTGITDSGGNTGITFDNTCEGASNSADASNFSFQRKTFKDSTNSVHWLFFHDGDQIEYKYSSNNGTNWTRGGSLAYDTNDFSVWQSSISGTEYIWLAVDTGDDIELRRGTLAASSITWDSASPAVIAFNGTGASDTYAHAYISLDSSNYIWTGARYYDGTNYVFKAVKSVNTADSTWTAASFTFATDSQLSDSQTDSNVYGNIVPLATQDMYATFVTATALEGCVWDDSDSAWEDSTGASCTGGGGVDDKQMKIDSYSASDTWTAPTGVTEAWVELWGAGGGGVASVGSGGGGAYAAKLVTVTPGNNYGIAVGTSDLGTDGGDTTFASTTVVADGGLSATNGATGGLPANSTGDIKFAGGDGTLTTGAAAGGMGAGDSSAATGTINPGAPNGGFSGSATVGSTFSAGGGSSSVAESAGARGHAKITYKVSPTALYPFVRSRSWNRSEQSIDVSDYPITLPSNYHVGDLLLAIVSVDESPTLTASTGWTKINQSSNGANVTQAIFYRVATGMDQGSISFSSAQRATHVVLAIGNAGTPDATFANGTSTNANPPSHSPAGGSGKYLWVATASLDLSNSGIDISAVPTGYSSFLLQPGKSIGHAMTGVSEKYSEASSDDPGTFTSTSEEWVASTIAVPYSASSATDKQIKIDSYSANDNWTAPTGVTEAWVELWGAGGGGTTNTGGGGGGAYAAKWVSVTPSNSYGIGVGTSAVNTDGGDTTFATTTVVADGGLSGANGGTGGSVANSTGDIEFAGGNGAVGTGNRVGGGGSGEYGPGVAGGTPGEPNGGVGSLGDGGMFAGGGGSGLSVQLTGSRGHAKISYQVSPTADYPFVRARSVWRETTSADSLTHPVSLPAGTVVGDLLVVVVSSDAAPTVTMNTGWTKINQASNGTTVTQAIFYRVATGFDTGMVTTSSGELVSIVALAIGNAGTPEATFANGSSTNANPPSHTPSGGSAKYLWLATGSWDDSPDATVAPANYGSFLLQPGRGAGSANTAVTERLLEASSDDPGTFTSVTEQWVAATISVPYQAASGGAGSQDDIDSTVSSGLTKTISTVADSTNYDVHLLYIDSDGSLVFRRWDNGTATWQTAVALDDTATDAYPSLSINSANRNLYAFYVDTSSGTIYYKLCTMDASECEAADWGSETSWQTGTNSSISSNYAEANEVFAQWSVGTTYVTIDWARITEAAVTTFTLSNYRWYPDNNSSLDVGTDSWPSGATIDLAENTELVPLPVAYDPPNFEQPLRLRVGFTVNGANLTASAKQFKLQYREATDTSCTTGSWTDLGGANVWAYSTSSVTDGATIVTTRLSGSDVGGQYVKSAPSTANENTATTTQDIEYDFHIVGGSAFSGAKRYLFRVVESSGTAFDAYTNCPALTTEPGTESLMRHGGFYTNSGEQGFWWAD